MRAVISCDPVRCEGFCKLGIAYKIGYSYGSYVLQQASPEAINDAIYLLEQDYSHLTQFSKLQLKEMLIEFSDLLSEEQNKRIDDLVS